LYIISYTVVPEKKRPVAKKERGKTSRFKKKREKGKPPLHRMGRERRKATATLHYI